MQQLRLLPLLPRRSISSCHINFSGHNKWSKIKEKKGINDGAKSVVFGKARQEILIAARNGGSADPVRNLQLSGALRRARDQGVPKENIEKALAKARGKDKGGESLTYEALVSNSVGMIIECVTDNPNRTFNNIREILTDHNARFTPVKYLFQRQGAVEVALSKRDDSDIVNDSDRLLDIALGSGAEDFNKISETDEAVVFRLTCPPEQLAKLTAPFISEIAAQKPWEMRSSDIIYTPTEPIQLAEEIKLKVNDLIEDLESDEDTLRVWTSLGQ